MFQSVQTGKNSQDVVFFFLFLLSLLSVDSVMFCFSGEGEKKNPVCSASYE